MPWVILIRFSILKIYNAQEGYEDLIVHSLILLRCCDAQHWKRGLMIEGRKILKETAVCFTTDKLKLGAQLDLEKILQQIKATKNVASKITQ